MTEPTTTKLLKWPFFLSDLSLLALAGVILYRSPWPLGLWQIGLCFGAVALGAWIGILPFLREYHALQQLAEAHTLSLAVAELKNVEQVKNQIANATSQWQFIQDQSSLSVNAAKEIADRMKAEVREFSAFMEKANETEKSHLRLEVEKLRRGEGEWLQVVVRILDHIYALNQAAARSGQPGLISQLAQFQHACRDAARRVGLVPFSPARHDAFDAKAHQLADAQADRPANAHVTEILATGYSYQGHLIRKALVTLQPELQPELPLAPIREETESPNQEPAAEAREANAVTDAQPVVA